MRIYSLSVRNRAGALLLALFLLGAGVAFFVVGFAIVAALAAAGGLLGAAAAVYNGLRGGRRRSADLHETRQAKLDAALEVFPTKQQKQPAIGPVKSSRGDDEPPADR